MRTHLDVEQREDIRRDLAERMKLVPPDLRPGEDVFHWQEHPGGNHCCQGPHGCHQYWHDNFPGKRKQAKETFGHRGFGRTSELARANRSTCGCGSIVKVKHYLSAMLDWQGLLVAAPEDLRTKKAESFSPEKES